MFKTILKYIRTIFISLFLGTQVISANKNTKEATPETSISTPEVEIDEWQAFFDNDCIAYDANSPEAIAESQALMGTFTGEIFDEISFSNKESVLNFEE